MKLLQLIPAFLLLAGTLTAQTVKKYVLIEHFTNSKCSICASKNPAFYNLIAQPQYDGDIHHISIHPSVPYNTCIFYLANPSENNARTSLYGVQGTPQVALNGVLAPVGGALLSAATLNAAVDQMSPLYLQVTESGAGADRIATVEARSAGDIPAGDYKIYAAVVEKTVNYNAPNGEAVHHDVFRKMLPDINGQAFTPAAAGESVTFNFNYTLQPNWVAGEVYVVAFVQNTQTKAILNSGTRFDPVVLSSGETADIQAVKIYPNPTQAEAWITLDGDKAKTVEVFSLDGRRVAADLAVQQETIVVSTGGFAAGVYVVKMTGEKGMYVAKLVKE